MDLRYGMVFALKKKKKEEIFSYVPPTGMSADQKPSIKCQAIDFIRGFGSPSRWDIQFSKDCGIAVVNCGSEFLFIFDKDGKKLGTLKFHGVCHCHDLILHQGLLYVVCGLKDGRIFSCSLQQWCHPNKKKKKNKSKSKSKVEGKSTESEKGNEHQELKEEKQEAERVDGEEDIFRDLLGGGDGFNSATKDGSQDVSDTQFQEFLQTVGGVTLVEERKMMLQMKNLEGFVIVNDSFITCCREGVGWRISVHTCQTNKANIDFITCDKNPQYSTLIFGEDVDSSHNTFNGPSEHAALYSQDAVDSSDERMDGMSCIGVYGLVSCSSHGYSNTGMHSCSVLVTSDVFFDAMWGSEANLVDSPVVLITLPDGCVYSILLKTFHSTSFASSSAKAIRLVCRSLEPVIQICTLDYSNLSNPAGSGLDCLVLVGAGGQLMVFYGNPVNSSSTEISRLHAGVPISVAVGNKDTLICASNFDMNSVTLHLKGSVLQMRINSFGILGVGAMALLKGTSSCYKLLAVKKNGTVLHLSLPSEPCTDMDQAGIGSTAARQRVHEALRNMREVSSKMAALTRLGSRQRALLEELSCAHHIVCQTWETPSAFKLESSVECIIENGKTRTKVSCKVTNCTSWTMSCGWTLIGNLSGDCDQRSNVRGRKYHRTKSIPLVGFAPKTTVTLSFVLDESRTAVTWPLTVQCSLCFDLSALLEDTQQKEDLSSVSESSVTLDGDMKGAMFLIGTSVVDALDSLQERGQSGTGLEIRTQGCDWTKAAFGGLHGNPQPIQQESSAAHNQMASIAIHLDKALLHSLSNDCSGSPSEQLLSLLLHSNQSVEVKGECIEAVTPCGCLVSIQALECDAEVIPLQVTSSNETITRGLVDAIHRRIKNSKLMSAEFRVGQEKMNKEESVAKSHLGKLLSVSDHLTASRSREDLNSLIKEAMDLHASMRSQIILH